MLMSGFRSLSYKEKLKRLKLQSLQARRIKHQLTFMFKMKYELIDVCFDNLFHEKKYKKPEEMLLNLFFPKQSKIASKVFHLLYYQTLEPA